MCKETNVLRRFCSGTLEVLSFSVDVYIGNNLSLVASAAAGFRRAELEESDDPGGVPLGSADGITST